MSSIKTESAFAVQSVKLELDEIVRNLKTDYKDWNSLHSSGLPLVNDMTKRFSKCLTLTKNLQKRNTPRTHNRLKESQQGLKAPRERLMLLVDRMLDSTEHSRENLLALQKLCAANGQLYEHIFYRNWQLRDVLDFAELIMVLYDAEYEIKEMVLEELTYSKDHKELNFICKAWREPRHALTPEFTSMFKNFNFETMEV